jgi:hypothetical protein
VNDRLAGNEEILFGNFGFHSAAGASSRNDNMKKGHAIILAWPFQGLGITNIVSGVLSSLGQTSKQGFVRFLDIHI